MQPVQLRFPQTQAYNRDISVFVDLFVKFSLFIFFLNCFFEHSSAKEIQGYSGANSSHRVEINA
jgi:hypothetical protein